MIVREISLRELVVLTIVGLSLVSVNGMAQTQTFTRERIEYVLELPSPEWQVISRLDVHDHVEFMYEGDRESGYLRLRKNKVSAGTTEEDLFRYDEKWRLQSLPGYIVCGECKGEKFIGRLPGRVFAYEYTSGGRAMAGRIYYLQIDSRTFHTLHFSGERGKLDNLRSQMDSIAGSFRLK